MNLDHNQHINSAGLTLNTQTGEVVGNSHKLRLSPVNSRVLKVLLEHATNTVSRQHIFDTVWPNQEVSDDALTRSISDLRAQLKSLTTVDPLIETIPKVGYRWLPTLGSKTITHNNMDQKKNSFWSHNLKPVLVALAVFLALLWGLLGWLYLGSKPKATPVVVLPTEHSDSTHQNHIDVSVCIKQAIMTQADMQYLSAIALESHTGNPFPYYNHEYAVRWIITSQIMTTGEQKSVSFNLVDAKTALVTYSQKHPFKDADELKLMCQNFVGFVATL